MSKTFPCQGSTEVTHQLVSCDRCGLIGTTMTVVLPYRPFERPDSVVRFCQWCRDRDLACEREARGTQGEEDI